ncbi:hypothetical protein P22_3634 [Propionispora sp. 2/2-37]|uniref:aminodeoxychorismate synthase component I n=1 Tax=Propionispora sp. 2/2-37 TaxID=1677858 RepID=UPI0006BB9673|nr:aminodeoxychorismate synthase component I [Propionispora sp. 2/2-37]CUH97503.1 hypothetical protein P22_3634 [Propionispora sp. 2/2-37]
MLTKTIKTDLTTFDIFLSLRNQRHPFLLDSGRDPEGLGRFSFLGADPFLTFSCKGDKCHITRTGKPAVMQTGDPFELLRSLLEQYTIPEKVQLPFIGGAVGYFGYEMCRFIEKTSHKAVDDVTMPDCFFGFYDGIYLIDHLEGTVDIVALGIDCPEKEKLHRLEDWLQNVVKQRPVAYHNVNPASFYTNMTKEEYVSAIHRIKEYIRSGDVYQVNFTQRFECAFEGDPISFYAALRSRNPAPFAAYIDTGEGIVVSSSPERFMKVQDGTIETRPIKGTISRGKTRKEDEEKRNTLSQSEKDRAELLMIVDLERNDLSRIAQTGTVRVPEIFKVETYATLHHLVATVTAELRPDCDLIDCVRAAFPGGSITGAPKIKAMEIIDELEPTQRKVYTGSIGYLGFNGNMDLNIVIRTVVIKGNRAYFQAGGGIVWDSDPEKEYQESLIKARALMETLQL